MDRRNQLARDRNPLMRKVNKLILKGRVMKTFYGAVLALLISPAALASVSVTSPANGATVTSPAHYVATATAPTCAKGVATMGIYVNSVKIYVVKGASLNYELPLSAGTQKTTV